MGAEDEQPNVFSVRKILCPVDFSASTERALGAAAQFARVYGADLYLMHVIEAPVLTGIGVVETVREATRDRLTQLAAGKADGLQVHLLVTEGNPSEEILRTEEVFGIDMIVLALSGKLTLGKIIFGSVTEHVMRTSEASIFVVRPARVSEPVDGVEQP